MKKSLLLLILVISTAFVYSQTERQSAEKHLKERGELVFTFTANNIKEVRELAKLISFDHGQDPSNPLVINAIANKKGFRKFLEFDLPYTVNKKLNEPKDVVMFDPEIHMKGASAERLAYPYPLSFPLVAYPTYQQYEDQMNTFATEHPGIAELVDIGGTVQGVGGGDKRLLFIKLSDNVSTREREPRVMYTSSMHGDEIAGFPTTLSLIDHLIKAYKNIDDNGDPLGSDHPDHDRVVDLLDNSEVWINPMANPDATYWNDNTNTSVAGSRRNNAGDEDLNRNYPDNVQPLGNHPLWTSYELETTNFMTLADNYHFVLSANFHGGTEVVNYPWDNTSTRHPDDDWYFLISKEYAVNCQTDGPSAYMDAEYTDFVWPGVTNGNDWYEVYGGRQDYMNFSKHCKEVTMELSNDKTPPGTDTASDDEIIDIWNYNKNAYIDLLMQGTYGFQGLVKDLSTGNPIQTKITLVGHDDDGSWVETELPLGDYYRPIDAGTYDILFEADCYQPFTLTGQTIADGTRVVLADVLLTPISPTVPNSLSATSITSTTATIEWSVVTSGNSYDIRYKVSGSPTWINTTSTTTSLDFTGLTLGTTYEYQVQGTCGASVSGYSSTETFTTLAVSYCLSNGDNSFDTGVTRVQFADLDKIDTDNTNDDGYDDFTAEGGTSTTTVIQDSTYSLNVRIDTDSYTTFAYAWIDFNGDGDFDEANEIFNLGSASSGGNALTSNSPIDVEIPIDAVVGPTRMRIAARYNLVPGSCQIGYDGEVEDYTITIEAVLGVENEVEQLDRINVYPNPVSDQVFVSLPNSIELVDYKISNLIGQVVLSNKFEDNSKINVSSMNTGVYFLSINTDKGNVTKKIVIQ
jgi:carboxypeptidase D